MESVADDIGPEAAVRPPARKPGIRSPATAVRRAPSVPDGRPRAKRHGDAGVDARAPATAPRSRPRPDARAGAARPVGPQVDESVVATARPSTGSTSGRC